MPKIKVGFKKRSVLNIGEKDFIRGILLLENAGEKVFLSRNSDNFSFLLELSLLLHVLSQ